MPEIGEIKRAREIGKKGRGKHIWSACIDCGKERWVPSSLEKPLSVLCPSCSHSGSKSSNWKGGRMKSSQGYILARVFQDDFFYSMINNTGYVYEHRLVTAKSLGRCLQKWEIVHHKHTKYPAGSIEDKQDNRMENLQLVTDDRHRQITVLENRIKLLEKRVTLLEAENIMLKFSSSSV